MNVSSSNVTAHSPFLATTATTATTDSAIIATAFTDATVSTSTKTVQTGGSSTSTATITTRSESSCADKADEILLGSLITELRCQKQADALLEKTKLLTKKYAGGTPESEDALKAATELSNCYFGVGDGYKGNITDITEMTDCTQLFAIGEAYRMGVEKSHTDEQNSTIVEKQQEVGQVAKKLEQLNLKVESLETTACLSTEAQYTKNMAKYSTMWDSAIVKKFRATEADPAPGFQWLYNGTYVSGNNTKVTILKPNNYGPETPLVIVAPGRSEPMRSYKEMACEFVEDSMAVAVLGFSGNGDIGYTGDVPTFAHYRHAITEMVNNANEYAEYEPQNVHLVAHSTGGFGAMNAFQHNALENVTSVSLIAPMFGLPVSGLKATVGAVLTAIKSTLGINPHRDHLEATETYYKGKFEGNHYTQSKQRFEELNKNRKETNQTAPTTSWVLSSLRESKALRDSFSANVSADKLPKFKGKINIYTGTADEVIDREAIHKAHKDLESKGYDISSYDIHGGAHVLHQEADCYRQGMMSHIHNTIKLTSKEKQEGKEAQAASGQSRARRSTRLRFS